MDKWSTEWCLWRDEWQMVRGNPTPKSLELVASIADPHALSTAVACTIVGSGDLPMNVGLHLFRNGVAPTLDDPLNQRGGHFAIRAAPDCAAERWWLLVLALLERTYPESPERVVGVSIVRKPSHASLKLWVGPSSGKQRERQRQALLAFLVGLPGGLPKFSPHRCILRNATAHVAHPDVVPPFPTLHTPSVASGPAVPLLQAVTPAAQHRIEDRPFCRFILARGSPLRSIITCDD
eukprot:TRINITY_DN8794_c0_g1_i1.p1 TRINITY_DN8794_c0_g1~~TRINITY_DN8794_c0_g1_i1.p1  ORF type:complete len:236 (-),score=10.10 TRINITY_DN8794_c0_g1_i1:132-839(-)